MIFKLYLVRDEKNENENLTTMCPRGNYPFYIVSYYIKWALLIGHKVIKIKKYMFNVSVSSAVGTHLIGWRVISHASSGV